MSTTNAPNPITMMGLAATAYDPIGSIAANVPLVSPTLSVVWGPEELRHFLDPIPYSLAYVACDSASGAYTVVIRGTDPLSWSSWADEDFDVLPPQPFTHFVSDAPQGAMISAGTFNGLNDLLRLKDGSGQTILQFLQASSPSVVYVTGHSLGGTLTPPLFCCLSAGLPGVELFPCSFAGLTPGNAEFNRWFTSLFDASTPWRFYNTLDFAPLCWWSYSGVQGIYQQDSFGDHKLAYGCPESDLLDPLFQQAETVGFVQPDGGFALQGTPNFELLDLAWVTQAMYQHHHGTYLELVNAAFGGSQPFFTFRGVAQPEPAAAPPAA